LLKVSGLPGLKMNKIQFINYPQVLEKIKKLTPLEEIRYRTTLKTNAGHWSQDEWFSDIESIKTDNPEEITQSNVMLSKFKSGVEINDKKYGDGIIKQVEKIGSLTVLRIKFDDHENIIRKVLNIEETRIKN